MTGYQPDSKLVQPVAPPTTAAYAAQPVQPSAWPKVIGIIAIVLGAWGMLSGLLALMSPFFLDVLQELIPENQLPKGQPTGLESLEVLRDWKSWVIVSSLLTMGIAALLLVAGIGLLKRRRWSVRTGVVWAAARILLVTAQSGVNTAMQEDQLAAMSQQMPNMPAPGSSFFSALAVMSVVMALAVGWAFPVFWLIWFSRKKIKAEVATWC